MSRLTGRTVLAFVIIIGFICITIQQIAMRGPGMEILIGAWVGAFTTAVSFYFGTTAGSQYKTDLLAKARPIDAAHSDPDHS